jgi:hypothetical protein
VSPGLTTWPAVAAVSKPATSMGKRFEVKPGGALPVRLKM